MTAERVDARLSEQSLRLVVASLVVATASRSLHAFGLPGIVDFIHIPLVVGAVAVSMPLIRTSRVLRRVCFWLGALFVVACASWIDTSGEVIRPVIDWLLLAEPALLAVALIGLLHSMAAPRRDAAIRTTE